MKRTPLKTDAVARRRRPGPSPATVWAVASMMAAGALAACGNYSNEDLEFMNVVPETADVSVAAPLRARLRPAQEDDALKMTGDVTTGANKAAASLLALLDKIRTIYPTSRESGVRIWGPWPADGNPGWQAEFRMTRSSSSDGVTPHFDYEMVMIAPAGTPPFADGGTSTTVLGGWFEATGRARGGRGEMILTPKEARDAGAVLKDLEKLVTLDINYDNRTWPRTLDMKIDDEPPVDPATEAQSVMYHHERAQNGDGALTFTFLKDAVKGPLGVETLDVKSRWLGTGEGLAQITVLAGDAAGFVWTDCWDATSQTSYNSNTGVGDQAACISIL
jgi:hypothetical protein